MSVLEAIRIRRSVRQYDPRPIPSDVMDMLKDSLRLAPSACNIQPWRFILVTDPDIREKLAVAAGKQMFIAQAPLTIVGCGFPAAAYKHMGGDGSSVDVDLAIAIDHLTLVAAEQGLGTCWIGAFEESAVKALLHIPEEVKVVAITPVGYPKSADLIRPVDPDKRKAADEIFVSDRFA